jgi:hypothetical protein
MAVSTILLGKYLGPAYHAVRKRAGREYHFLPIRGIGCSQDTEIDEEDD